MASNVNGDENDRNHKKSDLYGQLEVILKSRNKVIRNKELSLPGALVDDETDLSHILDDIPRADPHKSLFDNHKVVTDLVQNISQIKQQSGNIEC